MVAYRFQDPNPSADLLGMIGDIAGQNTDDYALEMPPALAAQIAAERAENMARERAAESPKLLVAIVVQNAQQKLLPVFHG